MNFLSAEEINKVLIDENSKPVIIFNVKTLEILTKNKAALHFFGYSEQEFQYISLKDLIDENFSPLILEEKTNKEIENIIFKTKNGKEFKADAKIYEIVDKEIKNKIIIINKNYSDTLIEEELRKLKEELNIIINSVGDGLTLQGKEKLIYANDAAAQICGFSTAKEFINTPINQIVKRYQLFDENNKPFPFEKLPGRMVLRTGEKKSAILKFKVEESMDERWSLVQSSPVFDEKGEVRLAINIFHDITDVKQAEEKIKISEKRYRLMIDQSPLSKSIISPEGKILQVNKAWQTLFGVSINELHDYNIFEDEQLKKIRIMALVKRVFKGETVQFPPLKYIPDRGNKKDKEIWIRSYMYPVIDDDGLIKEIVLIHEDISEQKKARDQVEESLKEKEVLLKEIHHRVKNNLQIISSLLNLQSNYTEDTNALQIITESQQRVKSMALIHEKLYQNEGLSKINFQEYIEELTVNLFNTYYSVSKYVKPVLQIDSVYLNIDIAVSLGLIINELISNSLKYGFTPLLEKGISKKEGILKVTLFLENDCLRLIIFDNGVGFPKNIDFKNTESLGLQLVNSLIEQHNGNIELNNKSGTEFSIFFPITN